MRMGRDGNRAASRRRARSSSRWRGRSRDATNTGVHFDGRCHCGNIQVAFETAQPPEALQLRECACTFCRRHGSTTVTDRSGRLEIRLRDAAEVSRYRFALRTADFIVCCTCGVFVAAVCTVDGGTYGTLNVNVLEARARFTGAPVSVNYDGETASQRVARRRGAWTPAIVREGSA